MLSASRFRTALHKSPVERSGFNDGRRRGGTSPIGGHSRTLAQPSEVRSGIESEDDLVRFLVAPISEPAALAHDHETALRQHANRRGVVARSPSVKRTGCLQLQELL